MIGILRHFRILIPLAVVALAASSAEAGFVTIGDEGHQSLVSLESHEGASVSAVTHSDDKRPQEPVYLKFLELDQLHFGHSPSSSGMSSGSPVSSGGSSAPAAILVETELPFAGPISPLYLREIPFTPQSLIAEIFRPPCA